MSTDGAVYLTDSDFEIEEEPVPCYVEPEGERTRPSGGNGGRYSDIYAQASRLVDTGQHSTLADAMEAIGVDLDRSVALHAWEASGSRERSKLRP